MGLTRRELFNKAGLTLLSWFGLGVVSHGQSISEYFVYSGGVLGTIDDRWVMLGPTQKVSLDKVLVSIKKVIEESAEAKDHWVPYPY